MGSDGNLKTWVSDQLMSIMGFSQPTVVQYMIGLSKKANSPADVVGKLVEYGLPSSSDTHTFAEELFSRVPRQASGVNLYQKQEREAAMLARKQMTYEILDADDEEDDDVGGNVENRSSIAAAPETRKADTNRKRFRKKNESHDDEDDEA
uniref:PWI domain-containing protein n=1 Tax=Fagus sylvatica TaxID=28930 RepID=A0A2N9HHT0_FAGSY